MARRSYTFGGDTGVTQEELNARRRVISALMNSQNATPKNVGEGLHYLGKAFSAKRGMEGLRDDQLELNRMLEAWYQHDNPPAVPRGAPAAPAAPPGFDNWFAGMASGVPPQQTPPQQPYMPPSFGGGPLKF